MTVVWILIGVVVGVLLYRRSTRSTGLDFADDLLDVAPFVAPAEPWPLWLLSPRERLDRHDPIREDKR